MVAKKRQLFFPVLRVALVGGALFSVVWILFVWNHHPQPPKLPSPSLAELAAQHNIELGNFAIRSLMNEKAYSDILTSQFNFVLADNTPNWYFTDGGLRPSEHSYSFEHMNEVIKYAQDNHMAVQAHHFVWGEQKWLPDWLKNGKYDKQQLLNLLHDHIQTVGSYYQGKVNEWTVVNEAFTREQHLYNLNDWWADHIGDKSYIDQSFIWARQADPNAKLILNDFNNESENAVSNAMYAYIKDAKARGIPIDGLGMQMHIDGNNPPRKDDVIKNMKRFADLGVDIYVTEFDVNMNDMHASAKKKNEVQGQIYHDMMRACIESQVCHSFAFLGITDKETWYNYVGLTDPRPLMFDRNYRPKRAYYGLRQALLEP